MKGASGERERTSRPALSLRPHRLKPVPAALFLSSRRRLHGAPPRNPLLAGGVRQSTQEIAVAGKRRAEADEIAAMQLVERA